jgi:GntR family transcriptional regulator / MocR family aminotransferase
MAKALSVSRTTVTIAYERLLGEGLATSRVGSGTFVSSLIESKHADTRKGPYAARAIQARAIWDRVALPTAFIRPARFDFRSGLPDASLFPHRAWRLVMAKSLRSREMATGVYESPAGHRDLREAIVRHINISRALSSAPDDLIVTNGTQQALDIVARVLLEPGDIVAMEDPGYQPPRHLFHALGARVIGVPVDAEGLVVDALPRKARVVYVTPSHQYPLGVAMSLMRRQALLAWAERKDAIVIEDDYDSEFRFGGRPLEPLQTLDSAGRVIYVGSFSKTMLPTLRLGFMIVPPSLRLAAHKAKFVSDWHTPIIAQSALARFIDDGSFARHIRRVSSIYRERHEILAASIRENFSDRLELIPSSAGLHVAAYARRASVSHIDAVAARAADLDVAIQRLSAFVVDGKPPAGIVLGYGAIETGRISEGLRRLRRSFDEVGRAAKRMNGKR